MYKNRLKINTNLDIEINENIKYLEELDIFSNNLDFDKIQSIIMKKPVIQKTQSILEYFFKKESVDFDVDYRQTKNFLVIFMIKHCKNDIFPNISNIEEQLIKKAIEIYDIFLFIKNNIDKSILKNNSYSSNLVNKFMDFSNFFEAWKKNDKKQLMIVLGHAYYDLLKTKEVLEKQDYENEEEKEKTMIWIEEIQKQKRQIEESIRKIGSEEDIDKLLDGSFLTDTYDEEIKKKVAENLKVAYWKNIDEEYNNENSDFSLIVKCIKDLKNRLQELVPSRNDLKEEWEKNIKYEILSQEIPNKSKKQLLSSIIKYIGKIILDLESVERNEELKNIIEDFEELEKNKKIEGVSKILCLYYDHIYYIHMDIQNLKKKLEEKVKTE